MKKFYDVGWLAFWKGDKFVSSDSDRSWQDGWRDAAEAENKGMTVAEGLSAFKNATPTTNKKTPNQTAVM